MLQDLEHTQDMPNEADIHLWTHGDDDEDDTTVRAMIDAPEDINNAEEDAHFLYQTIMSKPYY